MRKIITHTLVAIMTFSGATLALAETNTDVGATQPRDFPSVKSAVDARKASTTKLREELEDKIKDIKASTTQKIMEIRGKQEEKRDEMVQRKVANQFTKMSDRFGATIERENKILSKIESRIEKIKTAGGNTTEAEKMVVEAKTHLTEAQVAFETLKVVVESTTITTTATSTGQATKTLLQQMKDASKVVEKHIRLAHTTMEKITGVLKRSNPKPQATTTKEEN
ncbi:MAG TPA: hypothetical protein VJG67_00550 [Candidatus Paceibacterota bacterium]